MPLSIDLRKRVIAAVDSGMKKVKVAETFKVSRRVIYKWLELREKTNSLEAKSGYQKGHSHKITNWDEFKKFAEANKHSSVKKMTVEWLKIFGDKVSESVIERGLKKINYTSKKKRLGTWRLKQKNVKIF